MVVETVEPPSVVRRSIVLHFTPLHLIIGEVPQTDHPTKLAPLAVVPATTATTTTTTANKASNHHETENNVGHIGNLCNAIVWRKYIRDKNAFKELIWSIFKFHFPVSSWSSTDIYYVWKDHIDEKTKQFISDFMIDKLKFASCKFISESMSLIAYHTTGIPLDAVFEDRSRSSSQTSTDQKEVETEQKEVRMQQEMSSIGEYAAVDSSGNSGYHVPSLDIVDVLPDICPPDTGTIVHISDDSTTALAFAHGSKVGRVRVSDHGKKSVEAIMNLLLRQSELDLATELLIAPTKQALDEQIRILRKQNSNADTTPSTRDDADVKPKFHDISSWLALAGGEMVLNPQTATQFLSINNCSNPVVRSMFHRPGIIDVIKAVSHDTTSFDLADRLLSRIYLSGSASAIPGIATRLATSLQKLRTEEMRQSKAANKERKGSNSMARSWHLSQLNISHLEESIMDVQISVLSSIDAEDGILVPWRGACFIVHQLNSGISNESSWEILA